LAGLLTYNLSNSGKSYFDNGIQLEFPFTVRGSFQAYVMHKVPFLTNEYDEYYLSHSMYTKVKPKDFADWMYDFNMAGKEEHLRKKFLYPNLLQAVDYMDRNDKVKDKWNSNDLSERLLK
jgi:hypothetical protein